jgi:hypothetical protein
MKENKRPELSNETLLLPNDWPGRGGLLPVLLPGHDIDHLVIGQLGRGDFDLYPMIRPGALVLVDPAQQWREKQPFTYRTEMDIPIYFIKTADGYRCSWCGMHTRANGAQLYYGEGDELWLSPHPLSPSRHSIYKYPQEAQIVGRVVSVQTRVGCEEDEFAEEAYASRRAGAGNNGSRRPGKRRREKGGTGH